MSQRRAAIDALIRLLNDLDGPTQVRVKHPSGLIVDLDLPASGSPGVRSEPIIQESGPQLPSYQEDILEALDRIGGGPETSRRICREAGKTYNRHFGKALTELVRLGELRKTADGYSLPTE